MWMSKGVGYGIVLGFGVFTLTGHYTLVWLDQSSLNQACFKQKSIDDTVCGVEDGG